MPAPARKRSATLARPASESRPLLALVLALIGAFFVVAMAAHTSSDDFWFRQSIETKFNLPAQTGMKLENNPCGALGGSLAVSFFSLFGYAAFLIPGFILVAAWLALNHRAHTLWPTKVALMSACVFFGAPILSLWLGMGVAEDVVHAGAFDPRGPGGVLGGFIFNNICRPVLGDYGPWILVFPYAFCLLGALADDPKATLSAWIAELRDSFGAWRAERKEQQARQMEEQRRRAAAALELKKKQQAVQEEIIIPVAPLPKPEVKKEEPKPEVIPVPVVATVDPKNVQITPLTKPVAESEVVEPVKEKPVAPVAEKKSTAKAEGDTKKVVIVKPEAIERATVSQQLKRRGDYVFPPINYLAEVKTSSDSTPEDFRKRAAELIETLKQFKVEVVPVDAAAGVDVGIQQGPSITRYEIKPAPGVRVEKIAGLSNNIAMNLSAESVRILAPVPGRGTVGIEIPNRERKDVLLREIIESKAWVESSEKMEIPVIMGVDSVTNRPVIQDLAKMPHCLIAGSTGQGKSVCLNAFIASLLYRRTPADVQFIMVDPKMVELQVYNKLPHLMLPIETDAKRVPAVLKALIGKMNERYKIFAKCGVRNITGFNEKLANQSAKPKQEELPLTPEEQQAAQAAAEAVVDDGIKVPTEKLPYLVCIIDEMADLMMVAAKDIEVSVTRLAQLARAAGIHLVLATQRPSTDVITGLIKANIPTRIAFKVTSQIDSRTILDRGGAEALVGRGDMLFVPPGSANLSRVQGAYIGEGEISKIVDFLFEKNGGPEIAQDFVDAVDNASSSGEEGEDGDIDENDEDALVERSWEIIKTNQRASVSLLQRKLKLGYNRAARIMDTLHERGYVGPENGSTPREILR
jgi:DNA segregation ATPase FtsK/SpoIIIE, S-DNA-T family